MQATEGEGALGLHSVRAQDLAVGSEDVRVFEQQALSAADLAANHDDAARIRVNLERAMRLGDRLGGHMVQGHVDAVGVVDAVRRREDALLVDVRLPEELEPLMVPHGSVAIDGVSLTVNALPAPGILQLSLIEYTWTHTTLGTLQPGDGVHVEADMIGKYVRQLVAPYAAAR